MKLNKTRPVFGRNLHNTATYLIDNFITWIYFKEI